jgi:TonB family protein
MHRIASAVVFFGALVGFASSSAGAAEIQRSLFESENKNLVEPTNLEQISKTFPQIMHFGYAGKVLLQFDVNAAGKAENVRVIETTRDLLFDEAARKTLARFDFAPGHPLTGVHYEMSFCLKSDGVTPVFCDIRFQRVAGPERPYVDVYSVPYYADHPARKGYCGSVTVRFDVNNLGQAQNVEVVSASFPGQFEIALLRSLDRFQFEKNMAAKGIEYKVSFSLPGRCEAN